MGQFVTGMGLLPGLVARSAQEPAGLGRHLRLEAGGTVPPSSAVPSTCHVPASPVSSTRDEALICGSLAMMLTPADVGSRGTVFTTDSTAANPC